MDEVEISGKRYISTRLAAKEHKYHADYIGQLVRAKKIVGQKVGRSWYVDVDSTATYFGKEAVRIESPAPIAIVHDVPQPRPVTKVMQVVVEAPAASLSVKEASTPIESYVEVVEEKNISFAPVASEIFVEPEPSVVRDSIHIPIRRVSNTISKKNPGLIYMDVDEPALPEIKKTSKRIKMHVPVSGQDMQEVTVTEYATREGGTGILVPTFSIVTLGLIAFAIVALSSIMVSSSMVIEAGKAASVGYSLH